MTAAERSDLIDWMLEEGWRSASPVFTRFFSRVQSMKSLLRLPEPLRSKIVAQARQEREALKAFKAALCGHGSIGAAYAEVGGCLLHRKAMMIAAKHDSPVPEHVQREFEAIWSRSGDHLRGETGDDLVLADALRKLLPPYRGPALVLYRGDGFFNRCRRTYGLSWTTDRATAAGFANGLWKGFDGGSVLLETLAPPEAIIAPIGDVHGYGEDEFLVDRRRLRRVSVLERYAQVDVSSVSAPRAT